MTAFFVIPRLSRDICGTPHQEIVSTQQISRRETLLEMTALCHPEFIEGLVAESKSREMNYPAASYGVSKKHDFICAPTPNPALDFWAGL